MQDSSNKSFSTFASTPATPCPSGGTLRVETEVDASEDRLRVSDRGHRCRHGADDDGARVRAVSSAPRAKAEAASDLSVVYGIVKSLGGDVRVKSSPGKGARFDIFVPTELGRSAGCRRRAWSSPRTVVASWCCSSTTSAFCASSAKRFWKATGTASKRSRAGKTRCRSCVESGEAVSVVILDLVMPGIDGGETFRRLRNVNTTGPGVAVERA